MNVPVWGALPVLDEATGESQTLDLDTLRESLLNAFQRCAIREEWMADCLLEVVFKSLRNAVQENDGKAVTTRLEVIRTIVAVLDATGLPDVVREFVISETPRPQAAGGEAVPSADTDTTDAYPYSPSALSCDPRVWEEHSETAFLREHPELVPPSMLPEIRRRLGDALRIAGLKRANEALVFEILYRLVAELRARDDAFPRQELPTLLPLNAKTRYITVTEWLQALSLRKELRILLEKGLLALQPVSDILPVVTVKCSMAELPEYLGSHDVDGFLSAFPEFAAHVQECLLLMQGHLARKWSDCPLQNGSGTAMVRLLGVPALRELLGVPPSRKEHQEEGVRLENALREAFRTAQPLPHVIIRCS